jgi:hypothetical protein
MIHNIYTRICKLDAQLVSCPNQTGLLHYQKTKWNWLSLIFVRPTGNTSFEDQYQWVFVGLAWNLGQG